MAFDAVVGKDAKAYYDSATSYATPTWVLIAAAMDVSVQHGKNTADIATRESSWELKGPALKTMSVEVGYLHKNTADTVFDALLSMYTSDTVRQMAFMDGAIATSGNQGARGFFICTSMNQEQPLQGGIEYSFTFEPTRYDDSGTLRVPEWYEVP